MAPKTERMVMLKKQGLLFLTIVLIINILKAQDVGGYYFVMLNTNPNRDELPKEKVNEIQAAHLANIDSLAKAGSLVAAGPFNGGGGLFILKAESLAQAQTIMNSDPAIKADRFITELYPMRLNMGSICPVGENYEMTEYQFVKYQPVKEKLEEMSADKLLKLQMKHVKFLKEVVHPVHFIAEAGFQPEKGGFFVSQKGEEDAIDKFLRSDPLTKSGCFKAELKILWIAKGTFCENAEIR